MQRKIVAVLVSLVILAGFVAIVVEIAPKVAAYTHHDPIFIYGDIDFVSQAQNESWPGNGTEEEPYIIEGYEIDIEDANGIEINSTNVHFVIRNSLITGSFPSHGIHLFNVTNCTISNNTIEYHRIGIELEFSSNINIINNTLPNTDYGIYLHQSNLNAIIGNNVSDNFGTGHCITLYNSSWNHITSNNISDHFVGIELDSSMANNITNNFILNNHFGILSAYSGENNIEGNTIYSNKINGIRLYSSSGGKVIGNTMIENGIFIMGDSIGHWSTHTIDTSNTINGKPVYYWKNQTGGVVPAGAGQVILVNCTKIRIENQKLTNGSVGIELGFSSSNYISDNNISSNDNCIYSYYSGENKIANNTAYSKFGDGISLEYSDWNNITGNDVSSRRTYGFSLSYSNRNYITQNIASNSRWDGLFLYYSNGNDINVNTFSSNGFDGIALYLSSENNITANIFSLNERRGILLGSSNGNKITSNEFKSNNEYGIYIIDSSNNTFHHNNIINNAYQLNQSNGTNTWDDGNGEGNYWDDYTGNDTNGDGVGDTNLPHQGVDFYPLIEPDGGKTETDNGDSIFSELWFLRSIIILIFVIVTLFVFMIHKKKQGKSPSEVDYQENHIEQQQE